MITFSVTRNERIFVQINLNLGNQWNSENFGPEAKNKINNKNNMNNMKRNKYKIYIILDKLILNRICRKGILNSTKWFFFCDFLRTILNNRAIFP